MTKISLHETWSIMRDMSAHAAGNSEYTEAAIEHQERIRLMSEEDQAQFVEQTEVVRASLDAVQAHAAALTDPILEELELGNEVATWTAADVHRYLGRVQTTGEYAELLTLAILLSGDPRVLFDLAEPEEEEEATATDGD